MSLVAVGTLLTKMLDFLVNATHAFYIDHLSTLFFYFTLAEMNI